MRRRPLAGRDPGPVHRMIGEPCRAPGHDLRQQAAARATRERIGHRLVHEVMGRRGPQIDAQRGTAGHGGLCRTGVAAAVEQEIAIAHARNEPPGGRERREVGGEPGLCRREECGRLGGRDMPRGEVLHDTVAHRDEIAADRPVVGSERDALRGRLEGRAAGEGDQRVVADEAHARHLRARRQRVGHVVREPDAAGDGERVHARRAGGLERRASLERRLRLIGRPVGNDDDVFHGLSR